MLRSSLFLLPVVVMCGAAFGQAPNFSPPKTVKPTEAELRTIKSKTDALAVQLKQLSGRVHEDDFASVAVYHKAAVWIVRHGEFYTNNDAKMAIKVLDEGLARAKALAAGQHPWRSERGAGTRGYRSVVDGSFQPYIVVVPKDLPANDAVRLDVVLHGRGANLHEVRFLHDAARMGGSAKAPGLVLHVFGRTNNAYRWAGETDVFEAIDAVKREFRVDDNRVLLRGFSMGGAGAWHLGLHHPSEWAAVDAGAGFSETINYAKQKNLPAWRQKALHLYDATDYALNAFDVPMAGYGGEVDPQLKASENIIDSLKALGVKFKTDGLVTTAEDLDFRRIIGKGMGHKVDPPSEELLKKFRDEHAAKGIDRERKRVRFVTYTQRYGRAPWFSVEGLIEPLTKAVVEGELSDELAKLKTENVNVIAVDRPVAEKVEIDGQAFELREAVKGLLPLVYFRKGETGWTQLDYEASRNWQLNTDRRKIPGLQGPIDDAFMGPFLCVKPSGVPWNSSVGKWATTRLDTFARDWDKWMRGEIQVKADTEITPEDIERHHLILFGDPGSNRLLSKIVKDLPLKWTRTEVVIGQTYDAQTHIPVLIAPNPLNPRKYVVINSGHTLRASDFIGTNALLFPRLGDYAIFKVDGADEPETSGYFDYRWRLPEAR